jgi:bacterioferritin (cytochrome b1)
VAEEFLGVRNKSQGNADAIAERITQLDGEPDFNRSRRVSILPQKAKARTERDPVGHDLAGPAIPA